MLPLIGIAPISSHPLSECNIVRQAATHEAKKFHKKVIRYNPQTGAFLQSSPRRWEYRPNMKLHHTYRTWQRCQYATVVLIRRAALKLVSKKSIKCSKYMSRQMSLSSDLLRPSYDTCLHEGHQPVPACVRGVFLTLSTKAHENEYIYSKFIGHAKSTKATLGSFFA